MEKSYFDKIHKWGILWNIAAILVLLSVPIVICIDSGAWPQLDALKAVMPKLMGLYWLTAIVEVITYVPLLGAGGAYLSFVTGNISNLKLPCAVDAMERANVKATSEEGEIISTIAIAVSSIVTTIIVILGVIFIIPLTPLLENPVLAPAFDMILPALFGALGVVFISKHPKLAVAPIILMLILFIFVPALNASTVGIMVPVGVIFTIIVARIMYKKGML